MSYVSSDEYESIARRQIKRTLRYLRLADRDQFIEGEAESLAEALAETANTRLEEIRDEVLGIREIEIREVA